MPGILFVCTGNTCRSSMAAAIAAHLARSRGLDIEIASAGIAAREGDAATPEATQAVMEMGIDLGEHRARPLQEAMVNGAGVILTMTAAHKDYILQGYPAARDKTFTLKEYIQEQGEPAGKNSPVLDIPDPIGQPLAFYQATARELAGLVEKALDKFWRGRNPDFE